MGVTVLDAGVVIALGDTTDAHHEVSRASLREEGVTADRLHLPASALAEVLVGPIRTVGEVAGVERVNRLLELLAVTIVPLDAAIAQVAAGLRAQHGVRLRLPDALVVATAVHLRGRVLTTDAGWPTLPQVSVTVIA